MRSSGYLWVFVLLLIWSGCSSEKKGASLAEEGRITSLYVRFMEAENKVKAIADFRKVATDSNGFEKDPDDYKVWFQGRAMQSLAEFTGKNYYDIDLDYAKPGTFEFTVENSRRQVSTYPMDLNIKAGIEISGFKKGTGLMIDLKDLVLRENDDLVAVISDSAGNTVSSAVKGPSKGKILISQVAFDQLKEGACTLYFVWKSLSQETEESGRIIIREREFFFKEIKAELTK